MNRQRLDQALVARGLLSSRARARDAIKRGTVLVDGSPAQKAAQMVGDEANLILDDPAARYVCRAALKLVHALDYFGFSPSGKDCVDIGASTGGFCQVLLERGASAVFGVDVGHDQMHSSLRHEPRLHVLEGVNARYLDQSHIPSGFEGLTSDVSFISLRLALPASLEMARQGAFAALLVKPQFEVGRQGIGKGGLVRDLAEGERAARNVADWLDNNEGPCNGWRVLDLVPSPIEGGDGNKEYLLGAVKDRV